jgi:hypothetical protein
VIAPIRIGRFGNEIITAVSLVRVRTTTVVEREAATVPEI